MQEICNAEDRSHAEKAIEAFAKTHGAKFPNAVRSAASWLIQTRRWRSPPYCGTWTIGPLASIPVPTRGAQTMTQATIDHPFLAQRLREWLIFRAVTLKLPWERDDLLASPNWLQLKTAAGTNTRAIEILAEAGRTNRIRNTARTGLTNRSTS